MKLFCHFFNARTLTRRRDYSLSIIYIPQTISHIIGQKMEESLRTISSQDHFVGRNIIVIMDSEEVAASFKAMDIKLDDAADNLTGEDGLSDHVYKFDATAAVDAADGEVVGCGVGGDGHGAACRRVDSVAFFIVIASE